MQKSLTTLASVLILFACGASLHAQPPAAESDSLLQALDDLDSLEQALGNADLQLAEPLLALAEEYRRVGRFSEAHGALDRGMQIVRMNHGLYTPEQLPYLEKKIENYADWGNWEDARSLLEHLQWLHRTKTRLIDPRLVQDLMDVTRFHLRGISEDNLEFQGYHFRRALSTNWLAVAVAERLYDRTDQRLVPMLYSLLKQYHLQTVAVNRGGRAGYELRQIVPGTDWVRERSDMRQYFYDFGLSILSQLEDVYNTMQPPDQQAVAMVHLYRADWHSMYSRDEEALRAYQLAYDGLVAAGIAPGTVNEYLASPSLLPEDDFHSSLDTAIAARAAKPTLAGVEGVSPDSALYFAEWSASFPYARSPFQEPGRSGQRSEFAMFSLSLSGLTEISRWLSPRTVLEFGHLLDATLLQPDRGAPIDLIEVRRRLEWLHFRPRLVDGYPEESSATLVYHPAPQSAPIDF